MNRILLFPVLLLASFAGKAHAQDVADPLAALARFREAHVGLLELGARFIHTKEVPLFDEKIVSSGELFYRKPDMLYLQYTEPDSSRVIIADEKIWLYYPDLQQAHRYDIDPEIALPGVFLGFGGASDGVEESYDLELLPMERIGGWNTERLVLRPKEGTDLAGEVESIELTFRTETDLPVRCEFREVSGDHTIFEFSGYRKNPGLSPDFFTFSPPSGTEVFELEGERW